MNARNKRRKRYLKQKPDLDIVLEEQGAASMQRAKELLVDAEKQGFNSIVKTYDKDTTAFSDNPDWVFEPRYAEPVYPAVRDDSIARSLLTIAEGYKPEAGPHELDDRPLIDKLHEATFSHPLGLYAINDDYGLRMLLRKAHCFTLNEATSRMVADFSLATVTDLEAARRLAIPPFPVTWIELDNTARLKRMFELAMPLGKYDPENPPVSRLGWLIHPSPELDGWYATYVSVIDVGIWVAPLSYWWHSGSPNPEIKPDNKASRIIEWLLFGTAGNVNGYDAHMHASNLHVKVDMLDVGDTKDIMAEFAGELRHIWGFLIALAAGGKGVQLTPQSNPLRTPPIMKNGKPLLPLEHKVLHLHLNKRTPETLITQAITHHHNRNHDVRAHFRTLKSGKRVPVKSHERGDLKLGRVEKTYKVER
jgi:hypothetical protein